MITIPRRLEADAAQTAAGTFPRAIDVNAIDDCTVEGSRQRNRIPSRMGRVDRTAPGDADQDADQRQDDEGRGQHSDMATANCPGPPGSPRGTISRHAGKTAGPIATAVAPSKTSAPRPRQGRALAIATAQTRPTRNGSGRNRRYWRTWGSSIEVFTAGVRRGNAECAEAKIFNLLPSALSAFLCVPPR